MKLQWFNLTHYPKGTAGDRFWPNAACQRDLVCLSLGLPSGTVKQGGAAGEGGAKMGQTVRQSMPFNANHAFVHAVMICAEPQ